MQSFVDANGEMFACGTCLKIRKSESSDMCPMSTLEDLHLIIEESDKVLTFSRNIAPLLLILIRLLLRSWSNY
jgi:hypothetical protein